MYHDRHGIFERSPLEKSTIAEQLAGERRPTQFGRVLKELEIHSIAAHSPQAKGRVERVFGTLQDRLVVELRLAAANSLLSANHIVADYLPRFNERFGVPAEQQGSACRAMAQGVDLESIFCMKYERVVAADNTVQFAGQRLQLLADSQRRSWVRCRVEVQERLDGSIALYYQGKCLVTKAAPAEAVLIRARHGRRADGRGSTNSPNEQQEAMASKQVEAAASTCLLAGEAAERVQEAKDGEQAEQGKVRKKRPWDYPLYPERVTKSLNS